MVVKGSCIVVHRLGSCTDVVNGLGIYMILRFCPFFGMTNNFHNGFCICPHKLRCSFVYTSRTTSFSVYDLGRFISISFTVSGVRHLATSVSLSMNTIALSINVMVRLRITCWIRVHR